MGFIAHYHSAYPLVGIGHWGPFYYVVEALWMLVFGWTRVSVLLLSAVVTSAIGVLVYLASRRIGGGRTLAGMAGLACVLSPLMQSSTAAILLDGPIALLCLLSMLAYAQYLETARFWYAALFTLAATAGLLIKGNAGSLALLPPFALALSGRWLLLRRPSFWLPAVVVVAVAGPWYWATYGMIAPGFRYHWGWDYTSVAIPENFGFLLTAFGPLLLLAGAIGLARVATVGRRLADEWLCACSAALFAAVVLFQAIVPSAIQNRYLAPALPPLAILAVLGVTGCATGWVAVGWRPFARLPSSPPLPLGSLDCP